MPLSQALHSPRPGLSGLFWIVFSTWGLVASAPNPPAGPPYEIVSVNVSTPTNNAPLDTRLAYYRFNASNGQHQHLTHSYVPVSCGAVLSVHHTDPGVFPDAGTEERPILLLNHGYPESAYIWRKLTAALSKRVPLVVAEASVALSV